MLRLSLNIAKPSRPYTKKPALMLTPHGRAANAGPVHGSPEPRARRSAAV
jgi:hypothetical protein